MIGRDYAITAFWSEEGQAFVATCHEFPLLAWVEPTRAAAVAGFERMLDDVLVDLRFLGDPIPEPQPRGDGDG